MIYIPHSARSMDWDEYDLQEGEEPFDAVRKLAADPPPAGDDRDRLIMETKVQALVRIVKDHVDNLGSSRDEFIRAIKCDIPVDVVSYCKLRYDSNVSTLLKWHYCLALYVAERGEWLNKAIEIMLDCATSTRDEHRASSYLVIAHNLNLWYNCRMAAAVGNSALRLTRERKHSQFTHLYARVVACTEKNSETRDEVRDMLIRRAAGSDSLDARHCLEAAILVAMNKRPARLACMRFYEQCADSDELASRSVHVYNEALRHADGHEDRQRLAGKILKAARLVKFTEYEHTYMVPAQEIPGQSGLERIRNLTAILLGNMMPTQMIRQGVGVAKRASVGNDGVVVLNRDGTAADRGEETARWIQILVAYVSSIARTYEDDGRISADDHIRSITSSGLRRCAAETALIKAGIERHYDGDHTSSIHILLPLVESTLRALLEQKGVDVAEAKPYVQFSLLHRMIKEGTGILGNDLATFLHAWLTDTTSVNLRNRVCHGLYEGGGNAGTDGAVPHELNHGTSLVLILVIELLSGMCSEDILPPPDRGGR